MNVGQVQIQGQFQGSPDPSIQWPPYYLGFPAANPQIVPVTLAATTFTSFTTLGLNSSQTMVMIVPPNYAWPTPLTTYAGLLYLRGISSDNGLALSIVDPTLLSIVPTTAGGLYATGACSLTLLAA